ncbi:hypothetical protein GA0116948_11769 [Chitinophaga costaii]|uniref:Peptidase family C25 n=1 Tax=Chitinophaga costaii TaxID=1335309 RepID=A0A1C4FV99_9BACT|nr:hypothetical protein [Chitinophaga costaii]PUZ27253.1 hypothetical protein DCM91_08565 [Chitinophaga costaii]SCC59947.1 hypothetical protein GA0116948_11769 [Chitinophaga costaii]
MATIKLILTNKSALVKKYGQQYKAILADLQAIRVADKHKGIATSIIFLDDASQLKAFKAKAVKNADNLQQNKNAVDALYKHFNPAYILLAGAQDIIPFQLLQNQLFGEADEDRTIPSDLPYACDVAFDTNVTKFVAPTRVVGRLPDIPGKADAAYFHTIAQQAVAAKPATAASYKNYFAVSVQEWQKSTRQSVTHIFGNSTHLLISPSAGPAYTGKQLRAKSHFYNCHGAPLDPNYYGQQGANYPTSLEATTLHKKLSAGTIVAAECCYGAQLYNPTLLEPSALSVASTYLVNKAIAFMGSTTIAYGPADGQGLADLLTQYFMMNVLKGGASTGRALLEARQRFLTEMGPTLDPYELKTLAQFYLLGDPSVVPVKDAATAPDKTRSKGMVNSVQNRRDNMVAKGRLLNGFIVPPQKTRATPLKSNVAEGLNSLLKEHKYNKKATDKQTYINKTSIASNQPGLGAYKTTIRFHVYATSKTKNGPIKDSRVLVVKEKDNEILGFREYVRR